MAVTNKEVKKIAKLARLSFDESEYEKFSKQLGDMVNMIDQILEVDTDNVEPLTSVNNANLRTRKDEYEKFGDLESLFINAPGKDADIAKEIRCFVVPKVIE